MNDTATLALNLPLSTEDEWRGFAVPSGSRLLEPLRVKVAREQKNARRVLDEMPDHVRESMLWDFASDAVDRLDGVWIVARDAWRALNAAENHRDGYDTWKKTDLTEHIRDIRKICAALDALSLAVQHLAICEKQELAEALHENDAGQTAAPKTST